MSINARITTPTAADDGKSPVYNAATDTWTLSTVAADIATATIWDTKGDLVAGTANNTAARLAVGSNGQVLRANSATATGLEWATVSTDVATASIWDAKGDLAVGTGADTASRLAVGSDGLLLRADSTTATGLAWTNTVRPTATGAVGLVVNGLAGQTADLQRWQVNGTDGAVINSAGRLAIWPRTSGTESFIGRANDTGYTSVMRLRASGGTDVHRFDVYGTPGTDAIGVYLLDTGVAGDSQNRVRGRSAGIFFDRPSGSPDEWLIYRTGAGASSLYLRDAANGRMQITLNPGANSDAATVEIDSRVRVGSAGDYGGALNVLATATSRIGAVVRLAASQTANAVEVQNSGGTVLNAIGTDGRMAIGSAGSFGGGTGGIVFIANATAAPSSNPTGGGVLYVTGGALTYRGSSGTVTTIAPA